MKSALHPPLLLKAIAVLVFSFVFLHQLKAQSFDGLNRLDGFKTHAWFSEGVGEQARTMAERCDKVVAFYKDKLAFEPKVVLLVLSEQDWSTYTNFPVYGMPHYDDQGNLIVASSDNAFWQSFIPPVEELPADLATRIRSAYSGPEGQLSMRAFFDLLAIHELGHAFHIQADLNMQRKWMGELFANIFLHTYIAENEPELLPALTVFPDMVVNSTQKKDLAFTTLQELEEGYDEIGQRYPNNYGWYQCRWHQAAGRIYDAGGVEAFVRLWTALNEQTQHVDDEALAVLLSEKVHPVVADVQLKWDE